MDELCDLFVDALKYGAKCCAILSALVVIGGSAATYGLYVLSTWMAS